MKRDLPAPSRPTARSALVAVLALAGLCGCAGPEPVPELKPGVPGGLEAFGAARAELVVTQCSDFAESKNAGVGRETREYLEISEELKRAARRAGATPEVFAAAWRDAKNELDHLHDSVLSKYTSCKEWIEETEEVFFYRFAMST